jgi:O-antigen biosynthesis protein
VTNIRDREVFAEMASDDRDTMKPARTPAQADARAQPEIGRDRSRRGPGQASPQRARPILVLGMHRSGTSAIARILGLMGAYIGESDDLLPEHPDDNPTGYWERADINAVNDRLLHEIGHSWDRVAGLGVHDPAPDKLLELSGRLRQIIARLDDAGRPWLAKDPRLCLLLPQWLPLLEAPVCIVVVRDPREIAASMHAGPRGTFTSHYVVALWEKYLRTVLAGLHGRRALFVSYADMLADPQAQGERMLNGLGEMGIDSLHPAQREELAAFLDPRLRRSSPQAHVLLSPAQKSLYAWLDLQCKAEGPVAVSGFPQAPAPDAVLAEFEQALDDNAKRSRAEAVGEANERLRKIETMLDKQAHERTAWLAELAAQRQQVATQQAQLTTQREQLAVQGDQLTTQRNQLGAQRQLAAQARIEVDRLASNLASTELQRNELERGAAQFGQEKAHLILQTAALADSVHALRSSLSWKLTAPLRAVGGLFRRSRSFNTEQRLHHWFYSIPGINAARKRALVLWLHQHAAWLTRRTFSYQLYVRSREAERASPGSTTAEPRMDEARAKIIVAGMSTPPLISIVMPVYNVKRAWLMAAVESVRQQFYPHWELCIADDASTLAETKRALSALNGSDSRIKVTRLPANSGIAGASNAALQLATGSHIGLLDNDDALSRDALLEVAQAIVADDPDVLYSDEDKLDVDGRHVDAHFKSDFNLDYFLSINYLCHFTVLRRALIERIGGFRAGYEGAQDYDLFLRATEHRERVRHIPKVLYHWRMTPASTATTSSAKPKSWDAGRRALAESLQRRAIDAVADTGPYPNTYRVRRNIPGQPLVSILLPFRDKPELLSTCIQSVLEKTDYAHFEVVGIDNCSADPATHALMRDLERRDARVRFVRYDKPFNYSSVNNFGAERARGEHLLLLNNDTEVISAEWLRAMLEHSQRPEVGVVGAKLLYPDERIQHAGVIVGIGGVAGHAHLLMPAQEPGYFSRAQLLQNLSAVTFACAMTRRAVWRQLGGLNERDLSIAFNDIDYCLRAREAGYLVVYTPYASLYHYESKTRGYEDNPEKQARFFREITYMQSRHHTALERGDPYYNPNLRLDTHDFAAIPGYVDALPR